MIQTVKTMFWLAFLALFSSNAQDVEEAPMITSDMTSACMEHGFCEDIGDYPKELVKKLLDEAGNSIVLHSDTQATSLLTKRAGGDSFTALCESEKTEIIPKATMTKDNNWVWVVNEMNSNRQQKYTIELCKNVSQSCSNLVTTQEGYASSCKQIYAFRIGAALAPGASKITYNHFRLPSCCQCQGEFI